MTIYSTNEIIALVSAVAIGSGAYIGFVVLRKEQKLSIKFIFLVLTINLFVTYVASEILKIFKWGEYRSLSLPMVAFAGQYLMEWFDKRYLKIFDSAIKKTGLNINENKDETDTENIEEGDTH